MTYQMTVLRAGTTRVASGEATMAHLQRIEKGFGYSSALSKNGVASHSGLRCRCMRGGKEEHANPLPSRRSAILQAALASSASFNLRSGWARGVPLGSDLREPTRAERSALAKALAPIDKSKAPVLVRLVFHDAGTYDRATGLGGPNGSIQYELDRPESFGLKRGMKVINDVKERASKSGLQMSYADLIVLCGGKLHPSATRVCSYKP